MINFLEIPIGNQKLAASLHYPSQVHGRAPLVICCHGLTGSRMGSCFRMVALGRHLAERGIACLRFDFRGCGESDGRFIDLTTATLSEDLFAVIAAVRNMPQYDSDRLGIVGSSYGAFTAALAVEQIKGLRCLAFWAPVADVHALVREQMPPIAWEFLRQHGWVDHHGMPLGTAFFEQLPGTNGPSALAQAPCPLLIYHGTKDQQVPAAHGSSYEAAMKACGLECRMVTIETSDHGMRSVKLNEQIVQDTAAWMQRFL